MRSFHWIIIFPVLTLFFACDFLRLNSKKEEKDQFSKIFGGSLFDYFQIHNQALDVIDALTQDGLMPEQPAVLIHFDSHSDMYRVSKKDDEYSESYGQSYANYINALILGGKVDEIFWVLPDETRMAENQRYFWNSDISADEYPVMFSGLNTQTFYVDEKEKDIYFDKPEGYKTNPELYRTITFHKVVLDELRLGNHAKPVIIDIDADYFSNNGHDTANEMVVNYNEQKITRFLSVLENLGIKPILTMGALSPDFTHGEDELALELFFQDIGASTPKGDYLIGYRHHDKHGNMIVGKNIRRRSRDLYLAVYEMSFVDLRTSNPDSMTPINDTNAEYKKVNKRIQALLGVSEQKSAELLLNWDNEDGKRDSIIDYQQIEQNVQDSNHD